MSSVNGGKGKVVVFRTSCTLELDHVTDATSFLGVYVHILALFNVTQFLVRVLYDLGVLSDYVSVIKLKIKTDALV